MQTAERTRNPEWYDTDDTSTWDRIKAAMANDWEQTKNDFGSDEARDLDQDVDDTVKQAAGADDAFENHEQAFRFGHAARNHYGSRWTDWNDDVDRQLRSEYPGDYDRDRRYIRHGYQFRM